MSTGCPTGTVDRPIAVVVDAVAGLEGAGMDAHARVVAVTAAEREAVAVTIGKQ